MLQWPVGDLDWLAQRCRVPAVWRGKATDSRRPPVVDGVYVDGRGPYRFLLDTGLAKKIGMKATFEIDLASAAGTTALPGSDGNEVELGPAEAIEQSFCFRGWRRCTTVCPMCRASSASG